jgi:hypothetical protein
LPANPAGLIEISEEDLGHLAGGRPRTCVCTVVCTYQCSFDACATAYTLCTCTEDCTMFDPCA